MTSPAASRQGIRQRIQSRVGRPCIVKACGKTIEGFGPYCSKHRDNDKRYGSPTQAALRPSQLKPYRKLVRRFIRSNKNHPVLTAAYVELEGMLADAVSEIAGRERWPGKYEWRAKLHFELRRLRDGGVTGREIFEEVATVHLLSHYDPRALPPLDREFWFALSRAVLSLRERFGYQGPSGQKSTRPFSCHVLDHLGHTLSNRLVLVLRAMTEAIERQADAERERRKTLTATLEASPFN